MVASEVCDQSLVTDYAFEVGILAQDGLGHSKITSYLQILSYSAWPPLTFWRLITNDMESNGISDGKLEHTKYCVK